METFLARGKSFPLTRTYVMGILNVTPDSFSDGGRYLDPAAPLARAREILQLRMVSVMALSVLMTVSTVVRSSSSRSR